MRPLEYDDVRRALDWGLDAKFLESKTDSSVLVCLCQEVCDAGQMSPEIKTLFDWALRTGAQMRLLEANSGFFFQVSTCAGACWIWETLLSNGYSLDKVMAKVSGRTGRVTTKLGLLCSAPYCLSEELPSLIKLLIGKGVDPNERDSDGYAPLGRLNEQLRLHESNAVPLLTKVNHLVLGVEILLANGADIEGILPIPEAYAAKAIQECIRSRREQSELLQQVSVPVAPPAIRSESVVVRPKML